MCRGEKTRWSGFKLTGSPTKDIKTDPWWVVPDQDRPKVPGTLLTEPQRRSGKVRSRSVLV